MKLVKSSGKEWLDKEGYSKKIFLDEDDLNQKGMLVQKIKIKPGDVAKSHYHKKQTEIFYFLNTVGEFIVNGEKVDLKVDDVLVIEPLDKHEVRNDSNEDFLYMAFKFNYESDDLIWD
jgi:mannose-6-phosphate isomerase-like protein (cupin superfamily)